MKLKKILVANRGEIALRIIKTIKEMGLEAVAMYVEIDKNSQNVKFQKLFGEIFCLKIHFVHYNYNITWPYLTIVVYPRPF